MAQRTGNKTSQKKPKFTELNNLSNEAKILFATDDFFAVAENLLKENEAEWKEGVFDSQGKWMDGWETRRKRIPGHDFCIIKLPHPSILHGVHLDTSYFTGNFTPKVSLQAGRLTNEEETSIPPRQGVSNHAASAKDMEQISKIKSDDWQLLIPKSELGPGYVDTCDTFLPIENRETWTHLRLNYFPDGGIARLRIYGQVNRSFDEVRSDGKQSDPVDLVRMDNGGILIGFSNAHYGHPRNMIQRRLVPTNTGDGWETARRMDRPELITENKSGFLESPGQEWAAFKLGFIGKILKVEVDTTCFIGNYPDSCKVEGCLLNPNEEETQLLCDDVKRNGSIQWKTLMPLSKLGPNKTHVFPVEDLDSNISHVRLTIAPDGGMGRLRVWGHPVC